MTATSAATTTATTTTTTAPAVPGSPTSTIIEPCAAYGAGVSSKKSRESPSGSGGEKEKTGVRGGGRERTHSVHTKDFGIVHIPRRLRYDVDKPFYFGTVMNVAFGFASTFTVANLYYCQPLLVQLAESFNVSYSRVSIIPTLVQAGYAVGLLFLSPLGDLVRRRQLILALVALAGALTIGLAVTHSLAVFEALTFLVGTFSVTPMVLLPLAADLAPPTRRASAISVVLSGLLFGILVARVLAGVVAQFVSWRIVYFLAIGVQGAVLAGCWALVPDYPPLNVGMTYGEILWTMAKYAVTEPLMVQASLVNIAGSACFTNFWVTLTFLLAGPPYYYSTLVIGLFGLVGMFGVALGPLVGRLIDHLVPWHTALVSIVLLGAFQTVQVGAGGLHISAVIITAFALDVFRQMLQVSLTTAVFSIAEEARARLNAILVLSVFVGQVMGTAVGAQVFVEHGWRAGALLSLAFYGWQIVVMLVRGPHCRRRTWVGWEGGWEGRRWIIEGRGKGQDEGGGESGGGDKITEENGNMNRKRQDGETTRDESLVLDMARRDVSTDEK